ncbi:MAG: hypothetical protein NZ743_03795 [Pseudomonadales bacterium]|nr:hypothetical protein [Pseudomonadales bacterium]
MNTLDERFGLHVMASLLVFLGTSCFVSLSYGESLPDGPFETFYSNGQVKEKGIHKDGKRHGRWEQFYAGGQLKSKGDFENGDGVVKWFDKEGQWLSTERWVEGEDGERRLDEFDQNKQLIQRTYLRDNKPFRTEWFDEDGNLTETEFY